MMTQLQILETPLGSIGHTDSVDVGGATGLSVLFRDDKLCVLTRHSDYLV
jgi:hypothetical protein